MRLYFTDARHNKKWDIETPYEEHPTRKVTDPQDKIAKYKDYIWHCVQEEKDFESRTANRRGLHFAEGRAREENIEKGRGLG